MPFFEGEADALLRARGDVQRGDVLAVKEDLSGEGLFNAHDEARKRGLAAAVGAGDDHEFPVLDREAQIVDDFFFPIFLAHGEAQVFDLKHVFFSAPLLFRSLLQFNPKRAALQAAKTGPQTPPFPPGND